MRAIAQEVRQSLRQLRQSPGFTALARLLSGWLHGVTPFDPLTLAVVALILFAVALFASLLPALRAMRVNPLEALRYE
jgi:ABC-type antimicrobial peptide transport system permease subunit